jgi:hypothetical protein
MAITTLAGVLAGMQPPWHWTKSAISASAIIGKPYSYWGIGGYPAAGSFNTTLNGGTYSSSSAMVAGQIPHVDPSSGNSYLARLQAQAQGGGGVLILADRLWDNGGITITSTSAQSISSPAWPARDANGATSGLGVLLGVEVSSAVGAGSPTLTVGYTNSAGTASRTGANLDTTVASAVAGSFYRILLQAGDVGVQSVQSLTLSATWTSGTINLVAYRVLAALELSQAAISNSVDALTGGMPQIFNGTVPFLICIPNVGGNVALAGVYIETQG